MGMALPTTFQVDRSAGPRTGIQVVTMNVGPDKLLGPSTGDHNTRGLQFRLMALWEFCRDCCKAFAGAHKCTNPDVKEIL